MGNRVESPPRHQPKARTEWLVVAGAFAAKLGLHLALGPRYGYNGDELYFIACGRHLAFGYVDHAPMVPWIARLCGWLFGESLQGLRFFSALASALSVVLTMLLVRQWGGRIFALLLAALSMLIAPAFLRMGSILCIPVFEPLYWTLCAYLIVLLTQHERPQLWLLIGVVAGLGLLNKHTMLFWGLGISAGILLSEHRKHLRGPWLWLGGLIALLIFLPNLVWQHDNGWPTLEFIRNINEDQLDGIPRGLFLAGQLLYMHPLNLLLVGAGLHFFFSRAGAPYRLFGWLYLSVLALLFATHAKPYYLAPAYPVVFAAGAVMVERWVVSSVRRWVGPALLCTFLAGGAALAPFSLPLLPLPTTDRLVLALLGFAIRDPAELTLEFHEQYGWPEMAETVAKVYHSLPPEERADCTILAHDYGQTSALNFFGPRLGLPPAVSGHMSYYLWGPGQATGGVTIAVGMPALFLESLFGDVRQAATASHPLASVWERDLPVTLCRQPRRPLRDVWPQLKRYFFRSAY